MNKGYKRLATVLCTSVILATGCAQDMVDEGQDSFNGHEDPFIGNNNIQEGYNPSVVNYQRENDVSQDRFGYVRYDVTQIDREDQNFEMVIDREKAADMITRMLLTLDGYNEVATLVTDEEVLIAYEPNGDGNLDREKQLLNTKRTAYSVVPGWYEVYVTDRDNAYQDLSRLSSTSTRSNNYENVIEETIRRMITTTPQGEEGNGLNREMEQRYNTSPMQ
ncbi:YhcN/YlaJ family sporulation lipoprotein [Bacillaceae bacterium S4-13-58]